MLCLQHVLFQLARAVGEAYMCMYMYVCVLRGASEELKIRQGKLDPSSRPDVHMVPLSCSSLESTC